MSGNEHYVGLDVHKDTVTIAVADEGRGGEVRLCGQVSSDLRAVEKTLRKIGGDGGALRVVYEAGPTGFVLYRRLKQLGIDCEVVAPSKTPTEKGPRQKSDRRDALQLARLHRAGELTGVHVPDEADEAVRDLTRARSDAVHDLRRPSNASSRSCSGMAIITRARPTGRRRMCVTCENSNWAHRDRTR